MATTTMNKAITAIAKFMLTVPQIKTSFDLTEVLETITREKLPCAQVYPVMNAPGHVTTLAFMGNAMEQNFAVAQYVYWASSEIPFQKIAPALIKFIDDYFSLLAASPYYGSAVNPAVHSYPDVTYQFQDATIAAEDFHIVKFTHKVLINR